MVANAFSNYFIKIKKYLSKIQLINITFTFRFYLCQNEVLIFKKNLFIKTKTQLYEN